MKITMNRETMTPPTQRQQTPGPWTVNGDMVYDADGNYVAKIAGGNEANAKIIVSAPLLLRQRDELLAAAEELLADAIHCDPHFEDRWSKSSKMARAAIARATQPLEEQI